jgi:hypothetical protein
MAGEIQVDAWSAFVPGRGDLQNRIKEGVAKKVNEHGLSNLEIKEGSLDLKRDLLDQWFRSGEPRDYLLFIQHLGKTASAVFALRIAKRGTMDLELSWRLLEGNMAKGILKTLGQGTKAYLGIAIAGAGVITSFIGGGFMIPLGASMIGSGANGLRNNKYARNLTTEQQLDSRMLAHTVDYCLMSQLEELGVSKDELRVLQESHMEGIGKL